MNFSNVVLYDWVIFNKELAKKLLNIGKKNIEDRNLELMNKCRGIFGVDSAICKYKEVDPFSFFYFFAQRNTTNQRQNIFEKVKEAFDLESSVPTDTYFPTPVPNAISLFHDGREYHSDLLWKVFIDGVEKGIIEDQDFINVLNIKAVRIIKFTQTLFLINPEKFIPFDGTLGNLKISFNAVNNFTEYQSVIDKLKSLFKGCKLYEINLLAALLKDNILRVSKNCFQISSNAYNDGDSLESFFEQNGVWTGGASSSQDGYTYPVKEPQQGDIIIIRTGSTKVRAIGIVIQNTYRDAGQWSEDGMIKIIRLTVEDKDIDHQFTRKEALNRINNAKKEAIKKQYKEIFELLDSLALNQNSSPNELKKDDNRPILTQNIILYGPPGTGKTYHTIDLAVSLIDRQPINSKAHEDNKKRFDELKQEEQIEFITFHQNYSYEDFMIGLRPRTDEGDALTFKKHEGIFYQLCKRAEENYLSFKEVNSELKHYVLIIDEINRANISRVFGELITLLEDDKRIGKQHELRITLPNGERDFGIPPNLHVVGTMNTADKSISLVDIALRRRFEFIGKYPNYKPQDDCGYTEDKAHLLKQLNDNIYKVKKTADFLIGHAYFMKNEPIEMTIKNKVIPLLMEYFNNRTDEVKKIFHGTNWTIEYNTGSYGWDIITPKTGEA